MLDAVLDPFEAVARTVRPRRRRRYVSNVTGKWVTAEQAVDPTYWVRHLRHPVRFADGLRTVVADRSTVLVEVGPGHTLTSFARRAGGVVGAIPTLRHPRTPSTTPITCSPRSRSCGSTAWTSTSTS